MANVRKNPHPARLVEQIRHDACNSDSWQTYLTLGQNIFVGNHLWDTTSARISAWVSTTKTWKTKLKFLHFVPPARHIKGNISYIQWFYVVHGIRDTVVCKTTLFFISFDRRIVVVPRMLLTRLAIPFSPRLKSKTVGHDWNLDAFEPIPTFY